MAVTSTPIYTQTTQTSFGKVSAVDSSSDGTDTDVVVIYTAGSNGGYIRKLKLQPRSTSGSTSTSAAVARVYINNGSTIGTGTNNVLFEELELPIIAVGLTATVKAPSYEIPLNLPLKAGYKIAVGITAMAANTNWDCTADASDY